VILGVRCLDSSVGLWARPLAGLTPSRIGGSFICHPCPRKSRLIAGRIPGFSCRERSSGRAVSSRLTLPINRSLPKQGSAFAKDGNGPLV